MTIIFVDTYIFTITPKLRSLYLFVVFSFTGANSLLAITKVNAPHETQNIYLQVKYKSKIPN